MTMRNTLLLVDDTESRELLRNLFEDRYNLLEAETGEQAVLLLEQNCGQVAALLLGAGVPLQGEPLMQHLQRYGRADPCGGSGGLGR